MDFNLNDEQELFRRRYLRTDGQRNRQADLPSATVTASTRQRFVKALVDTGIDSLLIPKSTVVGRGVCYSAAVWMELGRLGAPTYGAVRVAGRVEHLPRRHTRAD